MGIAAGSRHLRGFALDGTSGVVGTNGVGVLMGVLRVLYVLRRMIFLFRALREMPR